MKFMKTLMISVFSIIVVGVIGFIGVFYFMDDTTDAGELSIDEMNKYSYETPEMTTDLEDGTFVRIQFRLITDGKKSVNEVSQREFQIQNILIKELATMTEDDFREGLSDLENSLKDNLNDVMNDGSITDVYTIDKILQ